MKILRSTFMFAIICVVAAAHQFEDITKSPQGLKKDLCSNFNLEVTQPKPNRATCNVECDTKVGSSLKCKVNEFHIPECKDFAAFVFKQIYNNFSIVEEQKKFTCEIQVRDKHKAISKKKNDSKKSSFCDPYRKVSVKSAFEFPCFLRCQTFIVGIKMELSSVDWELECDVYEQTCAPTQALKPINIGFICEAYRQFVLSKVKLGESNYHHCDVYNHGPQFDYFNRTKV